MPLLNTCPSKSTITISKRKIPFLVSTVVLMILASPIISSAEESSQQPQNDTQSGLIDVYYLDLPCDINSTCEVSKPAHLVEYFGADW